MNLETVPQRAWFQAYGGAQAVLRDAELSHVQLGEAADSPDDEIGRKDLHDSILEYFRSTPDAKLDCAELAAILGANEFTCGRWMLWLYRQGTLSRFRDNLAPAKYSLPNESDQPIRLNDRVWLHLQKHPWMFAEDIAAAIEHPPARIKKICQKLFSSGRLMRKPQGLAGNNFPRWLYAVAAVKP